MKTLSMEYVIFCCCVLTGVLPPHRYGVLHVLRQGGALPLWGGARRGGQLGRQSLQLYTQPLVSCTVVHTLPVASSQ